MLKKSSKIGCDTVKSGISGGVICKNGTGTDLYKNTEARPYGVGGI